MIYPLMQTRQRFWVDAPPDAVQARMQEAIHANRFSGTADGDRFLVTPVQSGRNSWRAQLRGGLQAAGGGTLVEVDAHVHPAILIFTIVHGLLLLGIAWVMGILAFSISVQPALHGLRDSLGASDEVGTLVEPLADGAEALAPWSLGTQVDLDSATFSLRGARGWLDTQKTTRLRMEPGGVSVSRGRAEVEIPWHEVAQASVSGRTLHLGGHAVDCADHPEAHLDWLVRYLRGRAEQLAATADERDAFADNARRLAAMRPTPEQ